MLSSIDRYAAPLDERRLLFHWAIEKLVARYKDTAVDAAWWRNHVGSGST
jgi:hypothetical protein